MNKALQLLSLARKGGRIEAGEEPVDTCIRMGRARLILLASDASEHTCRRIRGSVASSKQPYITIPFTKEELGGAIGRSAIAVAALTDPALAQALSGRWTIRRSTQTCWPVWTNVSRASASIKKKAKRSARTPMARSNMEVAI